MKKNFSLFTFHFSLLWLTIPIFGNIPNFPENRFSGSEANLGFLISEGLKLAFGISGMLLFIWMAWGIVQYILAGGDKEKLSKARSRITLALIGFIVILLSFAISQYLKDILKPQDVGITP